jgi:hypothetical protein
MAKKEQKDKQLSQNTTQKTDITQHKNKALVCAVQCQFSV